MREKNIRALTSLSYPSVRNKLDDIIDNIQQLESAQPVVMRPWEWSVAVTLILLQFAVVIWMISLMFNAYRVSANLKGVRAGLSFGIGLFVAQIISNILIFIWILPLL